MALNRVHFSLIIIIVRSEVETMPTKIKPTVSERVFRMFNYTLLTCFCVTIILPFLNILALSFNDGTDASAGGIYFWPRMFTLENYSEIFKNPSIGQAYLITIYRTVIGTIASVFLTAMAAYGLKSKHLPGRNKIIGMLLLTTLFSGGLIPYYLLLKSLLLTKSFLIYILPSLYGVWNIIIMRTFFDTINLNLEESARIDGCNDFQIFLRVILPLSKPVLSVIALFNGVTHWNDWFTGAFFVRDNRLLPIQTILQKMLMDNEAMTKMLQEGSISAMQNQHTGLTTQSLQMAMVIFTALPILFVYPFIQKYFAQGFMIGSIKG